MGNQLVAQARQDIHGSARYYSRYMRLWSRRFIFQIIAGLPLRMQNWGQHPLVSGWLVVLMSWGGFFTLLWPRIMFWTPTGISAGWIGVWADWSVHMTYAAVFAYRPWWQWLIAHPLYVGKKFTYPFLADAISGWLMGLGVDTVSAFVLPSIVTTLLCLLILYALLYFASKSLTQAYVALTLFIASGGLGFWWWIKDLRQNFNWGDVLFPPLEYTHIGDITLEWINIISGQLLPQRALLLGLVIVGSIIVTLQQWSVNHFSKVKWLHVAVVSVATATLLITHVHSFIMLVIVCAVWSLLTWRSSWSFWWRYAVMAGVLSVPLFWYLYGGEINTGFMRWHPGWLAHPRSKDVNWWWFWFLNWGFFLPTAVLGSLLGRWRRSPLVISGWLSWILANLFLFQPYDWDNSKILTWSYLFLSLPVSEVLMRLWVGRWRKIVAVLLFVVLTLSGFLDIWRLTNTSVLQHQMWSNDDLIMAAQFRRAVPPGSVVLASDKHNHWVSTHTGSQMLLGYRGWMWTYGIDYSPREADMKIMFAGGAAAEKLLAQYGVAYVVIGAPEIYDWEANEYWYAARYPIVLSNAEYTVYQVQ